MLLRDLRWAALLPIGAVVACTSILGNDFTIVEGSGGTGGTGTGTGTGVTGGAGGTGGDGTGGTNPGGGGTGGMGGMLPALACDWSFATHAEADEIGASEVGEWTEFHTFRLDDDRARVIHERSTVTAGNVLVARTLDAVTQTVTAYQIGNGNLLDVQRTSSVDVGALFRSNSGQDLRLTTVSNADPTQTTTNVVTVLTSSWFPGIDPSNGVAAMMTPVNAAGVIDLLVRYYDSAGTQSLVYGRYQNSNFNGFVVATNLPPGSVELGAMSHHDGVTYAYTTDTQQGGYTSQHRLDATQGGLLDSRPLEPQNTAVLSFGTSVNQDRFTVFTFASQLEIRVGEVPTMDFDTFELTDLALAGTYANSGDLPVKSGARAWLDQVFVEVGPREAASTPLRHHLVGPNGTALAEGDLPFTAAVSPTVARDTQEVTIAKRSSVFGGQSGDVHVLWTERQDEAGSVTVQMYYDVLRCTSE